MSRGNVSGYSLKDSDIPVVLAMSARGDRNHDIAAWFGVNQGRIAEVKHGKRGMPPLAEPNSLPPSGPPGIKGRRLRSEIEQAFNMLNAGETSDGMHAIMTAIAKFDQNEG